MGKTGRVRALARFAVVRLVIFFVVLLASYVGVQIALALVARHAPEGFASLLVAVSTVVACIALLLVYVLLVRWVEQRAVCELALRPGIALALAGALIGFALFCTVYGVLWAMGIAHWGGFVGYGGVVTMLLWAMISGVGEELVIRGGVFRILEGSLGTLVALVLSAGLFGLLHAMNRGATVVSTAAIALEAGILLGAAFAATRNLWLAIGLHFGWNFTEGGVFGAAVSGFAGGDGLVRVPLEGPPLLTGGEFGPEASVVAVGVCLVAAAILLVITVRRRQWVPLRFSWRTIQ